MIISGNILYVADAGFEAVVGVNLSTDVISLVAGGNGFGSYCGDGDPAIDACLNDPTGLAVQNGILYIADSTNGLVRAVNLSTGIISTVAGTVVNGEPEKGYGGDGGPATSALLQSPQSLAIAGNTLYMTDNQDVRAVNLSTGIIYKVAGTQTVGYAGDGGPATSAEFSRPEGLWAAGGYLYVADTNNSRVREINVSTDIINTLAGNGTSGYSGDGGPATSAELNAPWGLTTDDDNLYIADSQNFIVRSVTLGFNPDGSTYSLDALGGGSASELCSCGSNTIPTQVSRADPVDTAIGDLYETTTDISLPGAGVPLTFTRTYDADAAQNEVSSGADAPVLGYGWSSNLAMSVESAFSTAITTVTEENGAQTSFAPYASGTSPSWCSGSTNFCATAPRIDATLNHNSDGSWSYVRMTGSPTIFTFNAAGELTEIADSVGNTLSSSAYSPSGSQPACPSGDACTAWTSSASGRQLVEEFDSTGTLTAVIDPNSSLAATFSYSGSGCSSWSESQTPDLCGATDPGNLTATFTYDSSNSNTVLDYDMLSELPPGASTAATDTWNSSGQVTQQASPTAGVTTFSYSGNNSFPDGGSTTVTTYPDGTGSGDPTQVSVYYYASSVLAAETLGDGTSSQSTSVYSRDQSSLRPLTVTDGDENSTTNTYDTLGNTLTSTDAMGNTTETAYNSFSQGWCSVDAANYANGARCPASSPSSPPAPDTSDPDLGMTISFFNPSDQLAATTDALGNTTTYSYTSGVTGVPNGLQYCSVDPVDYQKGVTCPAYGATHVPGTTTGSYDSAGDKTSSSDADGNATTYAYGYGSTNPGLVSSEVDPDGTTTAYTYDGEGEVTQQVVSFGTYAATTLYAYDSYGRKYCEVDPNEAAKGVACPSSPPSSPPTPNDDSYLGATITTYDASGRVVQSTNPIGGIIYTAYDQAGGAFCSVAPYEASIGVTCPSSAPSSPPTIGDDPYLGATITTYDPNGRVIQTTNPLGGITLDAYDAASNVIDTTVESDNSTDDPPIVTSYSYNADNRQISKTIGVGSSSPATTQTTYDPDGNAFCTVSANAYAAGSSAYQCPTWQPGWISTPPSPTSLYSATPDSAQADNVTTTFHDANGDQLQSTNPDVETSMSAFDPDGRSYCSSDPTNVSSWLTANPASTYPYLCPSSPPSSPPAQGSDPGYTTTIYDAAGRTHSSTDQVGDTTSYSYDPAGHVLTTTDPRGKVTINCYYYEDSSGQCAASAPTGGGSGDDEYFELTPPTSKDDYGAITTTTYYPGGQSDVVTNLAGSTTNTYDANGDLTGVSYSGTGSGYTAPQNLSYTYYPDGSRETMTDATGTTTYAYDAMGDETSQTLVAEEGSGLSNATTSYGYFSTGVLASVSYPSYSGHTNPQVAYSYDALGNMTSETDWLGNEVAFAHDEDGNLTSQENVVSTSNPNGTSATSLSYDAADQNTSVTSALAQSCGGDETLTQSFSGTSGSRNPDNQLTENSSSYAGSCSGQASYERDYSYDEAGRVVYQSSSSQGSSQDNISYDASGDPTTISSHDSQGNFDTYTQSFSAVGEVTSQTPVAGSQGVSSTYGYDSLGDQVQAATSTSSTTNGFDQTGRMVSSSTDTDLQDSAIASGSSSDSGFAFSSNGAFSAFGYNANGQLGNGNTNNAATAVKTGLSIGVTPKAVSAGGDHSLAVGSNGYGYATGLNVDGQLGNGTDTSSDSWVKVSLPDGVYARAVSAGMNHSMAIGSNGEVYTWGLNSDGQLGDGGTTNSDTPVEISLGTGITATAIAAGQDFSMALGSNGEIYTWGLGTDGQLGNAQRTTSETPVEVSLPSGVTATAIAAGGYHAMAIGSNGKLYAWGDNADGQVGDGTSTNRGKPVVVSMPSGVTATDIAAGGYHSLAVGSDGNLYAWGLNEFGELGDGNTTNSSVPAVVDMPTGVSATSISAGSYDSLAVGSNGEVYSWGYNGLDELGDGNTTNSDVPVHVQTVSAQASYAYSGDNLIGTSSEAGVTRQFTWNTNGQLSLLLSDGSNDYIYGPGTTPVEQVSLSGSTPTYMTYTSSDDTWLTTNSVGDETGFWGYDAFGNLAFGTPTSPFGYAGQYTDLSTGLSDMRARWYQAQTGEFTTLDPAFAQTNTAYTYAGDDPVNETDSSGQGVDVFGWFCLGNCGPQNYSSSSTYSGPPVAPAVACGQPESFIGPCLPFHAVEVGDFLTSQNLSFTVTGPGDLYLFIYNQDDTNTDTSFQACLSSPNPANQCQGATLSFNHTMETYFPGRDAYLAAHSVASSQESLDDAYNVQISAESDSIWSLFNFDFGTSPLYELFAGTTNGNLSRSDFSNAVQSVSKVTLPCGSSTSTEVI